MWLWCTAISLKAGHCCRMCRAEALGHLVFADPELSRPGRLTSRMIAVGRSAHTLLCCKMFVRPSFPRMPPNHSLINAHRPTSPPALHSLVLPCAGLHAAEAVEDVLDAARDADVRARQGLARHGGRILVTRALEEVVGPVTRLGVVCEHDLTAEVGLGDELAVAFKGLLIVGECAERAYTRGGDKRGEM